MPSILALWLPILVSATAVFVTSSLIHMFLGYHDSDVGRAPGEDEVLGAIRRAGVPPGEYVLPYASRDEMGSEEFVEKRSAGPVAILTVVPGGPPTMSRPLIGWFIYTLVVSVFAAYVAGRAMGLGPVDYLGVFRFAGATAFAGYGLALWHQSIWWGRPWMSSAKSTLDALVYALVTAGVFGWLWPGGAG